MVWLECHLCPGEVQEAVVLDTTETCCWQLKPSLHSCTTCWSNWWKCPAHKCAWFLTSHAGFLTHFLNSHNPSLANQFLIWSNCLQTGQEFKIGLQHVHIKLEIACQSWDFARQSTMARLYACTMYTFVLELLNGAIALLQLKQPY